MCSHGEGDVEARVDEERSTSRVADLLHAECFFVELTIRCSRVPVLHSDSRACSERLREPSQQLVVAERPVRDDEDSERERRLRHCTRPVSGLDADA